jgi:transposase
MEEILTLVVNAQHIKAVPGRKTDVKDSGWIADLLRHGLLKGSFIPNRDQRELKELVRYRRSITEERAREINRIQKVLEGANIKLASVVSSIDCTSARKMLNELVAGNNNIEAIANLAIFPLSNKVDRLKEALFGLMGDHQRLILKLMLKHIDDLDGPLEDQTATGGARLRSGGSIRSFQSQLAKNNLVRSGSLVQQRK